MKRLRRHSKRSNQNPAKKKRVIDPTTAFTATFRKVAPKPETPKLQQQASAVEPQAITTPEEASNNSHDTASSKPAVAGGGGEMDSGLKSLSEKKTKKKTKKKTRKTDLLAQPSSALEPSPAKGCEQVDEPPAKKLKTPAAADQQETKQNAIQPIPDQPTSSVSVAKPQSSSSSSSSSPSSDTPESTPPPVKGPRPGIIRGPAYASADLRPVHYLFVDKLPFAKDSEQIQTELRALFRPYGHVVKLYRKHGAGCGWMNFRTSHSIEDACRILHGKEYDGRWLRVEPATRQAKRIEPSESKLYWTRQIAIKDLPDNVTKIVLRHMLSETCKVEPDFITLNKRGTVFVTLPSEQDVEPCIRLLNRKEIFNKRITVEPAQPPRMAKLSARAVVKGEEAIEPEFEKTYCEYLMGPLPMGTTIDEVRQALEKAGCKDIATITLVQDKITGRFKGVAYIRAMLGKVQCERLRFSEGFGRRIAIEPFQGVAPPVPASPAATTLPTNKDKEIK